MLESIPLVCGIHQHGSHPYVTRNAPKILTNLLNVCTAADWMPGVSIISGIARTIFAIFELSSCDKSDNDRNKLYAQLFRGVIATIGLGILFAPADLYYSFNPAKHSYA